MHRLQISVPAWQAEFLHARARRDGLSIAAVIRGLVQREADAEAANRKADTLLEIIGIAEDAGPLIDGLAVSESPETYLTRSA